MAVCTLLFGSACGDDSSDEPDGESGEGGSNGDGDGEGEVLGDPTTDAMNCPDCWVPDGGWFERPDGGWWSRPDGGWQG